MDTKEQIKKIKKIKDNFFLYAKNNLKIKNKDGDIVPLVLNTAQKELADEVLYCLATDKPIRILVLKARQMGLSTIIEAIIYWWTATHKNVNSYIIAHEDEASKNLYKMFKRYYDNSNMLFKPTRQYDTRTDLTFAKTDDEGNQVGLNSIIKTATAKNSGSGRSDTAQLVHGCLHEDSLVVLADGSSKMIKDIELNDMVFTSSGAVAPISAKTMTGIKKTYKLSTWMSNEPIVASKDHKILTDSGYKKVEDISNVDWIAKPKYQFKEVYTHEFSVSSPERLQGGGSRYDGSREFDLDYGFGYLIGYYLAEGHISKDLNRVTFTYHKDEAYIDNILHLFPGRHIKTVEGNRGRSIFNDGFMARMINDFCGRAGYKHVPLLGNEEYYKGLYRGYMDGDGSKTDPQRERASSIHEKIARNINRIGDMLGNHGSIQYYRRKRYDVDTKDVWINGFCHGKPSKYRFIDGQCFVRVKSVDEYEVAKTYDLEVDHPDHNFETPGGIVSNSEVAFWDNGEENVAALLQTVPLRPKTMVFLESTANGRGNYFAKEWANAAKGDSIFTTFFFPWWAHDEYELEGEEIGELSGYEKELIKIMKEGMKIGRSFYKVEDQEKIDKKIRYYRYKSLEFRTRPELLMQEYPSTPHEAFIASGASVFNSQALAELEKRCEETKTYELVDNTQREISAAEDAFGKMKIWDMPVPGEEYVVGADVAEGLSTGDYSVADVIRKKDMKTVARYRGQVDPDQFGYILDKIGRFYNYALLGVEINNHGLAVVQRLRDLFYPNLYRRETRLDEVFEQATSKFGWKTTSVTKPLAIDYLAEAIREGHLDDRDIVFIEEAFSYVRDERGRMNAEEGTHDDTVMAKAIALQMWDWAVNNKEDLVVLNKGKTKVGKKRKKVIG